MNFANGDKLLTVKDVARKITFDRSEDGIAKTMRQVRHWTQSDLLKTESQKNTGKGVPRLYALEPTIEIAAILLELTRYGATVDILKHASDALYEDWTEYEGGGWYISTALTDTNVYLQVAWDTDPKTGLFTGAHVKMFDDIDLDIRDQEKSFDPEQFPLMHLPSSSILINMTQVVGRIPWSED